MKFGMYLVIIGYFMMLFEFGWWGLLAAAANIALMLGAASASDWINRKK